MSNFCIVPWTHIEISPSGDIRPCCEYESSMGNINDKDSSIIEAWNNDRFKQLRQDYLDGVNPKGCAKCQQCENVGIKSRRQYENKKYKHLFDKAVSVDASAPAMMDIKFGNICNIKCRICSSKNSHVWKRDEKQLFGFTTIEESSQSWVEIDSRWNELSEFVDNLEVLYISGGEPLLIKKNYEFLRACIEKNKAKNISVRILTNGTITLESELIEILKHFKHVYIGYSIDDLGEKFNYQRNPAKWDKVEKNFLDALSNNFIDIGISYSISIFNVLSGSEFIKWCNDIKFPTEKIIRNFVRHPNHFDISMLTPEEKEQILKLLGNNIIDNDIKNYLTSTFTNHSLADVRDNRIKIITGIDQLRNEQFGYIFPELNQILRIN
jgi:radical SAM protein with 4Fe4S-binding SPASM domain